MLPLAGPINVRTVTVAGHGDRNNRSAQRSSPRRRAYCRSSGEATRAVRDGDEGLRAYRHMPVFVKSPLVGGRDMQGQRSSSEPSYTVCYSVEIDSPNRQPVRLRGLFSVRVVHGTTGNPCGIVCQHGRRHGDTRTTTCCDRCACNVPPAASSVALR